MDKKLCVLPCNGIDKSLGVVARIVALKLIEKEPEMNLICPVLLNTSDERYETILKESNIVIIDGCMTRCATKLVDERNQKIFKRIFIPAMSKQFKIKPGTNLELNENGQKLAEKISIEIIKELKASEYDEISIEKKLEEFDFYEITVDKYYFQVQKMVISSMKTIAGLNQMAIRR